KIKELLPIYEFIKMKNIISVARFFLFNLLRNSKKIRGTFTS
ncbi:MAG: hypothetical protein ACI976_002993, partial [Aureispira sp.]